MTATATATKPQWVARIHPRMPSRGFLARVYLLSGSGYPKFEVHRGWYAIDAEIIPRLRRARNRSEDPDSKPVFQICTLEQAEAVEEAEEIAAAAASKPIPVPRSRLSKLRPRGGGKVEPKKRVTQPEPEPKKPAFYETADPDDPDDHEFMGDDEWPEDLNPTDDQADDQEQPVAAPRPARKAKKKKPTRAATKKKKPTRAAKKKPSKKASKKKRSR